MMMNTSLAIQARPNLDEFDNLLRTGGTHRQRSQCRPVDTALQSVDPGRREREFVHRRLNGWGSKMGRVFLPFYTKHERRRVVYQPGYQGSIDT